MEIKRLLRWTLQGISFGLVLTLCGCASEQPVAVVHPLALQPGAKDSGAIVAGDHIGLHVYTNANAEPAPITPMKVTDESNP